MGFQQFPPGTAEIASLFIRCARRSRCSRSEGEIRAFSPLTTPHRAKNFLRKLFLSKYLFFNARNVLTCARIHFEIFAFLDKQGNTHHCTGFQLGGGFAAAASPYRLSNRDLFQPLGESPGSAETTVKGTPLYMVTMHVSWPLSHCLVSPRTVAFTVYCSKVSLFMKCQTSPSLYKYCNSISTTSAAGSVSPD